MNRLAACLLLACALPAVGQQGPNDVEVLKKYSGTWAVNCSRPTDPRLTVDATALGLQVGDKRVRTGAPLSAFSYFGKMNPPAGFDVALLGEGRPTGLSLLAMADPAGPYFRIDADPPLEKLFGKAALSGKFRRCP